MHILKRNKVLKECFQQNETKVGADSVEYLTFPNLENIPGIRHLVTSRFGGASEKEFATMNMSFDRGDVPENVLENYRRVGKILNVTPDRMVLTHQTHTTNIKIVTAEDAGKGITIASDIHDIDGFITKEHNLCLTALFADCVPLIFVDPVKQVIGVAHSGWRGTAAKMGRCMVERMQTEFGCNPTDLIAAVGPCICRDCYEVSEDVAAVFANYPNAVTPGNAQGKYQLDLIQVNQSILLEAGIPIEHIALGDICTKCNSDYLFSHRVTGGKRGALAAMIKMD